MKATSFGTSMPARSVPGTLGLIASLALTFLVDFFAGAKGIFAPLAHLTSGGAPWTFITYPWALGAATGFIGLVFSLLWIWFMGSTVEREVGTSRFLLIFAVLTLLGSVFVTLGAMALTTKATLAGSLIPSGALTMLWAARRPRAQIMIYGILPVEARWIALFNLLLVFFLFGTGQPALGLFAVLPLVLAWFYAAGKLPIPYPTMELSTTGRMSRKEKEREQKKFENFIDDVRERERERAEKEKLRQLFERSLIDDPDDHREAK